jgi:hypothetical protein
MTAPMLDVQIEELRASRIRCAELVRELGQRELDARQMRLEIENELRKGGMAATVAERQAKADPRYLGHEEETTRIAYSLRVAEADAEVRVFNIRLQLTVLERVGV